MTGYSSSDKGGAGFLADLFLKFRLMFRLLADPRVDWFFKLIPFGTFVYLIMPLDFLFGPIDDAVIIYAGIEIFLQLCPQEILQEHLDTLKAKRNSETNSQEIQEIIVDTKFKDE